MNFIKRYIQTRFGKKRPRKRNEDAEKVSSIRKKRRKCRYKINFIFPVLAVVLLALFLITVYKNWCYRSYRVLSTSTQEDTQSTDYTQLGNYLLKYTSGSANLLDIDGNSMWSETYEMSDPVAEVCDSTAVIYDQKGNNMVIVGESGKIGSVSTDKPILKARVASQGVVAAILEDGDTTWVNFYSTKGEEIATAKTRVDSPGYPVDLSVSPDGLLIMVSYMYVEDSKTTSYVAFYNFGDTGQDQVDNIVSGYTYADTLVPQVQYLQTGLSVSFSDAGFVIYKGKQIPKVSKEVKADSEIISTFYDDEHVGMIYKSGDSSDQYTLVVYDTKGNLKVEENFDIEYTKIKISNDQIIMNNDSQIAIYNMNGHKKFSGTIKEGTIQDVFHVDGNRYQVVIDSGIETIKLKM